MAFMKIKPYTIDDNFGKTLYIKIFIRGCSLKFCSFVTQSVGKDLKNIFGFN